MRMIARFDTIKNGAKLTYNWKLGKMGGQYIFLNLPFKDIRIEWKEGFKQVVLGISCGTNHWQHLAVIFLNNGVTVEELMSSIKRFNF